MKNIIRLVVIAVLVFCAVPVFAGTAEVSNGHEAESVDHKWEQEGSAEFLGIAIEGDGRYQHIVGFREGSELSQKESSALRKALSKIKERLPKELFFEIARFPEVPKYFAKLSDGHVYVAIGSGPTVEAAFSNLVANFK